MNAPEEPPLAALLAEIRFYLREPLDFCATDTASTIAKVRILTAAAVYFNTLAVADFGGRPGRCALPGWWSRSWPRPSRPMAPRTCTQGRSTKPRCYVGHPWPARLSADEVVAFCLAVSAGDIRDVAHMARGLQRLWGSPPAAGQGGGSEQR
jgi:hypothetical protein